MFLDALEQLHRWRRKHLPGAETPQGAELLVWVLKNCDQGAPLKELYRSSRFSEPTVRASLKQFLAGALVTVEVDAEDSRRHLVRSTPKLEKTVNDYVLRIRDVAKASLNEPRRGRSSSNETPPSRRSRP
jgi:DNA-binding MarR family transcriptional regulator